MTFEDRLGAIHRTLDLILVALQSGAQIGAAEQAQSSAPGGTDEGKAGTTRKRRTKEEIAADEAAAKAAAEKEASLSASATAIANQNQGNASTTTTDTAAGGEVTWDDAVAALKKLAASPAHGNTAVLAVIKQIDPNAANVPALKALNKNAEIVAAIDAVLNPAAAAGAEVDPLFG